MGAFSDAKLEISCPGCGHKISKTVGYLKSHSSMTCPSCGRTIRLENRDFRRGIDSAERQIEDLKRKLKKFGR